MSAKYMHFMMAKQTTESTKNQDNQLDTKVTTGMQMRFRGRGAVAKKAARAAAASTAAATATTAASTAAATATTDTTTTAATTEMTTTTMLDAVMDNLGKMEKPPSILATEKPMETEGL